MIIFWPVMRRDPVDKETHGAPGGRARVLDEVALMSRSELLSNVIEVLAEFISVNPWGGHSLAFAAAHHDMAMELADSPGVPGDNRFDAVVDAALRLSNFTKRWGGAYLTKDLRMGK